ncbi:gas vesicle protein [Arthrobacter sp. GCM10027362]|uniref:gas vesicle protein GvpO n=1 Tax=Arthrobacter sp. GCM10027362 TaxID=3273379 RepID=UPI00363A504D
MAEEQGATRKPPPPGSEDGGEKPARRPESRKSVESRPGGSGPGSGATGGRPSEARQPRDDAEGGTGDHGATQHHPGRDGTRISAVKAARAAMSQLEMLTNREAEGIVAIGKNDDGGWTVVVEVVESRYVPATSDLLAEYEVVLDRDGELVSYSRGSRYVRGRPRGD